MLTPLIGSPVLPPRALAKAAEPKDWTILYCLDGNNDLEPYILQNVLEMETVGSSPEVNIVAQLSRAPRSAIYEKKSREKTGIDGDWVGCRRYLISQNPDADNNPDKKISSTPLLDSPATPNHGDPRTLSEFLIWGITNFPAKHYMVVISDHGEGFRGTGFDKFYGDHLDLPELRQALETARAQTGIKPDLITFDTCLMAHAETAYQLKDAAQFMVASEELVGAEGLPNIALLKHLKENPHTDGRALASKLVDLSRQDAILRKQENRDEAAPQMSAIDLSKAGALGEAFKDLGQALKSSHLKASTLETIVKDTKHFDQWEKPLSDFRDVIHFCQNLEAHPSTNGGIKKAARELQEAAAAACLNRHNEGKRMEHAQGLSVYLPTKPKFDKFEYGATDFEQATNWSAWLRSKFDA